MATEVKFEDSLRKLEALVSKMESGEMGLDEMIAAFEDGRKLVAQCQKSLDAIRLRIEKVTKSGAVEPIAALITMALTAVITPVLPYILSFAAGAMIYVVIDELVPEAKEGGNAAGTVGAALGFALMMLLDIAFG